MSFLLKDLAYYKTGGRCREVFAPSSLEELCSVVRDLAGSGEPYFLLGAGTNSLVLDTDWRGSVISFHSLARCALEGAEAIYAEAGVVNSDLAKLAYEHSLAGLSWMYRLPGQLGATVRMNARCYGGEISQVIRKVYSVTRGGELKVYENPNGSTDLFKGYKNTVFMNNGEIVAACEIQVQKGDPEKVLTHMQACENDRLSRQQFLYPSCGCVFKNDYSPEVSVSSGLLLDLAGAKTLKVGQAEVSPYHCNFIYNKGASSSDILELSLKMRELVWQEFGVWLEYEMELLGEVPEELASRVFEKRSPQYRIDKLELARAKFARAR